MMSGGGDHCRKCENDPEVLAELKEWNALSQTQRAISSISFVGSSDRNNSRCRLAMSCKDSQILRNFCMALLKALREKSGMIENVIKVNMKNKEKLESQSNKLRSCEKELSDLKEMMPAGDSQMTAVESRRLIERCRFLEGEVRILNERITRSMEEDENQRIRSDRAFEDLFKKLGRGKVDDSVLTIIDSYERKLSKFANPDLRCNMANNVPVESPTLNFKLLLKNYDNKLDALNKKVKQLQTSNDLLRTQLQSSGKSARHWGSDDINSLGKRSLSSHKNNAFSQSTGLVDLNQMSSSTCRKYLEVFCREMEVTDLENVVPSIVALKQNFKSMEFENFYREVEGIVGTTRRSCQHEASNERCNKNCLLSALKDWSGQRRHFKDLQESLKNLSQTLFPWQPIRLDNRDCSVENLVRVVDEIAKNGSCRKKCKHDDLMAVDKEHLVRMVEHFQKLFDVPNAMGVVPRMSQLYVKLTENYNVMTNIKELLGLKRSTGSIEVLDKLSKLSNSRNLSPSDVYHERCYP